MEVLNKNFNQHHSSQGVLPASARSINSALSRKSSNVIKDESHGCCRSNAVQPKGLKLLTSTFFGQRNCSFDLGIAGPWGFVCSDSQPKLCGSRLDLTTCTPGCFSSSPKTMKSAGEMGLSNYSITTHFVSQ